MKEIKVKITSKEIKERLLQTIKGDNAELIINAIVNTCVDDEDALSAIFLASIGIKPKEAKWDIGSRVLLEPRRLHDWSFNKEEMTKREIIKKELMAVEIIDYNPHKDRYLVTYDYVTGDDEESFEEKSETSTLPQLYIKGLEEDWPI